MIKSLNSLLTVTAPLFEARRQITTADMEEEPPASTAVVVPAPFVINSTDRAGIIVVVTTFCLISVWFLFVIRAYIRVKVNGPWKIDDTCVAVATV